MTYPAQPGYPPQAPQQPQYPAPQGYAPPAQQYPPQQPGYPAPQGYAPQQPQYAPQQPQYAPSQQAQPQGPPPAAGSLDAFWAQPATGWGPAWKINAQTPIGTQFAGVVARKLTDSDVEHQEKYQQPGVLDYFRDGRPKMIMKVPLFVQPGPDHPDGRAQFYVSGSATTELIRAMAEAGAQGEPEEGATIYVTVASKRQNRSGTMSNVLAITYQRPQGAGAAPAAQPAAPAQTSAQPPTPEQPATLPPQGPPIATYAPPAPPQAAPQAPPAPPAPPAAPAPQQAYQPPAPPQAAAPAVPPAPGALPPEVANDPAKLALLQSLGVQTPVAG